jgi:hypothetical protein
MKKNMKKANYFSLSYNYWTLIKSSIDEMEIQGNKTLIVSSHKPNETIEQSFKNYYQKTKWNDVNIGVPILFNFYHGLELCMKGLLQEIEKLPTNKTHKLTDYFELILENASLFIPEILTSIGKVMNANDPFFFNNNSNLENYHKLLRYPESKKGNIFSYDEIKRKGKTGLKNFKTIKIRCVEIENAIIKWFKLNSTEHE